MNIDELDEEKAKLEAQQRAIAWVENPENAPDFEDDVTRMIKLSIPNPTRERCKAVRRALKLAHTYDGVPAVKLMRVNAACITCDAEDLGVRTAVTQYALTALING